MIGQNLEIRIAAKFAGAATARARQTVLDADVVTMEGLAGV
jgi:hypothetical protein